MSDGSVFGHRKRLNGEEGTAPTRKRGRYTAAACNECKKRKTKCSGSIPCRSCKSLDVECVYSAESAETLSQKNTATIIQDLQRQVQQLWEAVHIIRSQAGNNTCSERSNVTTLNSPPQLHLSRNNDITDSSTHSTPPRRDSLRVLGPTSSGYSLQIAEPVLRNLGVPVPSESDAQNARANLVVPVDDNANLGIRRPMHSILSEIGPRRMLELMEVYAEEIGLQYPFLNVASLIEYVKSAYYSSQLRKPGQTGKRGFKCDDGRDDILAATLAVSLAAQRDDKDVDLSDTLMDSLEHYGILKGSQKIEIERHDLTILILKGMYYFFRNDERLAWRTIGIVARLTEECGINRQSIILQKYEDIEEREWIVKLFWSVFVLDRRWSFGTGLSFALQDSSIDLTTELPDDYASRYLKCMIDFCHIASKVWQNNLNPQQEAATVATDERGFLEYLISDWMRTIPSDLQVSNPEDGFQSSKTDRAIYRLRLLLYLRANQMRILIYRNVLFTQSGMVAHKDRVKVTVDTARETIRILVNLNNTSDIYKTQQISFNHFLDSALTVLVLAICHAPNKYLGVCRGEFHAALELIQTLSVPSPISTRLWQVVRQLKHIAFPETGVAHPQAPEGSQIDPGGKSQPQSAPQTHSQPLGSVQGEPDSGFTYHDDEISNSFWELFEAGNSGFAERYESSVAATKNSRWATREAELASTALSSSYRQQHAAEDGPGATPESNSRGLDRNKPGSTQAVDITGQRSLQRTELDFFDLAPHIQSPNITDLSNEMFFF